MKKTLKNIWNLYYDGFKNMTWGRPLWLLIFLKVIILFLVLRMFFFKPVLSGKDEAGANISFLGTADMIGKFQNVVIEDVSSGIMGKIKEN